jgi:YggT family protein
VGYLLAELISLYSLVVLAAVVLSWVPAARNNQIARYIEAATEPAFARIRRVVPPLGGLDLSPLVLLVLLHVLRRLVA